ncbi:Rne/Rng family ribonuclease [Citricoccus sp. NR2]|uniref:Rne/Rng family ribonuclease n=1 Tax=Citricoccus sp. NR2 TaxID=3004095 RepID=UPI003FA4CE22
MWPSEGQGGAAMAATPSNETTESTTENTTAQPAVSEMDLLFQAPDFSHLPPVKKQKPAPQDADDDTSDDSDDERDGASRSGNRSRRRRSRGNRTADSDQNRNDRHDAEASADSDEQDSSDHDAEDQDQGSGDSRDGDDQNSGSGVTRRRRRRRRGDSDMELDGGSEGDPENTVTRVRAPRQAASTGPDAVTSLKGSTRLEAKRQRRRDNRGQRRRHVITEAEFLARRESVDRKMMVRQHEDRIQITVMEDGVLAEHFVSNTTQDSLIGNVYLGKVQNVLPSMEAAFIDIGRGRNAVLYAGEVNWDAAQLDGKAKKIENALKSGDSVLVQVTKDPVGHKGARLTSQISLPGRYLVYVPGGSMTGISRKLPDVERNRLKKILKDHLPENAGVIVRTAAEGTSEDELMHDINRLRAQWETIESKSTSKKVLAPELLYAEPDLTIKVVRDVFNEDFSSMVVQGDAVWDNIEAYVTYVAPHLLDRLEKWEPNAHDDQDLFEANRLDEQLHKALERKVNLPSGGSLVIDRTEAMTVVDVNTGKFTGSGGNLEETVTKNNLEAAEEIVRQLRLRDIGGIIVIDFIDMVLESNRDLVLRRLVECLGRDRTKHQVAEVTSLGLVQMTRKRMGTGLVEVFSESCEHCNGRGIIIHDEPIEHRRSHDSHGNPRSNKSGRGRQNNRTNDQGGRQQNEHHNSQDQDQQENSSASSGSRRGRRRRGSSDQQSNGQDQQQTQDQSVVAHEPEETPEEKADREARAEQTRNALASIAAASHLATSGEDDVKGSTESPESPEPAETLTIGGEPVEVPQKRSSRSRRSRRSASLPAQNQSTQGNDSTPDAGATLNELNSALDQAEEQKEKQTRTLGAAASTTRPRRRRAASSDGANVTVQSADDAQSAGEGSSFTATAKAPSAAATGSAAPQGAAAPVMLGVGVKAEEISSPGRDS